MSALDIKVPDYHSKVGLNDLADEFQEYREVIFKLLTEQIDLQSVEFDIKAGSGEAGSEVTEFHFRYQAVADSEQIRLHGEFSATSINDRISAAHLGWKRGSCRIFVNPDEPKIRMIDKIRRLDFETLYLLHLPRLIAYAREKVAHATSEFEIV